MPQPPNNERRIERTLLPVLLALFLFATPFTFWWAQSRSWFLPYLLWLLIIVIGAWLAWRDRD